MIATVQYCCVIVPILIILADAAIVGAQVEIAPNTAQLRTSAPHRIASSAASRCGNDSRGLGIGNIDVVIDNQGVVGLGDVVFCNSRRVGGITYPARSQHRYGWFGLVVGGVRGKDTLVSAAFTPWASGVELWPSLCTMTERFSPRFKGQNCFESTINDSAISDQDVFGRYEDTLTDPEFVSHDRIEGRIHRPLGIQVNQRSYAWGSGSSSHLVIIEFEISNIGVPSDPVWESSNAPLKDMFVGILGAPDARYAFFNTFGDDLVGFIPSSESPFLPGIEETFNTVWMADNDGDPKLFSFNSTSVPDVVGLSLLRKPTKNSGLSFNWWNFHPEPSFDWGPVKAASKVEFQSGQLGTPNGDRALYQMMSNQEIDYPQLEAALDHQVNGWLPAANTSGLASDVADGASVLFLVSTGPFDLPRDSSVTFTISVVGGRDFHSNPRGFHDLFDPLRPNAFQSQLNKEDLLRKVQWAKWTYDNPGVDTDGDGFSGEWFLQGSDTVYVRGDGVPDIRAALPPRPPILAFYTRAARIAIRWNGRQTETETDAFLRRVDFEGYRVYMSRTARDDDWMYLSQRDLFNYGRYTWNETRERWELNDPPFTLDSLKELYDALTISRYGYEFHPDSFKTSTPERALLEVFLNPDDPSQLDSIYRSFGPFGLNNMPDDKELAEAADIGLNIEGVIRKLYPDAKQEDLEYRENGTVFFPYWEYEFVVSDIQVAEPVFLAVTAFDHGDPVSRLESLESSKSVTTQEIWPINAAQVINSERPGVGVYPNPYRIIDGYNARGWENRRGLEPDPERARQVTFYNVPDTCTVSIWSIDGDLVRELPHASDPGASDATVVVWNLITRNTQAVKTGIYIYSVESRFSTDVGKLVIIK